MVLFEITDHCYEIHDHSSNKNTGYVGVLVVVFFQFVQGLVWELIQEYSTISSILANPLLLLFHLESYS